MIKIVTNKPNIIREKKDLLGVRQWIRGIESPRACRANPSGHRAFEPLRELVLMKRHGKSLSVQKLFVGEQFPLRPIHSLASRSHLLRLLLRHANESITHRRNPKQKKKTLFSQETNRKNPEIFRLAVQEFFQENEELLDWNGILSWGKKRKNSL